MALIWHRLNEGFLFCHSSNLSCGTTFFDVLLRKTLEKPGNFADLNTLVVILQKKLLFQSVVRQKVEFHRYNHETLFYDTLIFVVVQQAF